MTGSLQLPGRHQINPQDILQNHSTAEYVAVFVTYFKELDQSPQNPKLPHSPENVTQPLAETPKSKLKVYINLHNQKPLKENHEMFTWEDGGNRFPVTDEDYVNSLDAVIMDEAAKSNFWDGWKWIHRLKWAVSGLLSLVVTAPIIYAAVRCIPFSRLMVAIPKLKFRRKSRKHLEAVELQPTNNPDARPPGYNEVPLHSHVTTRYVPNIGIVWNDDCLALPIENSPK